MIIEIDAFEWGTMIYSLMRNIVGTDLFLFLTGPWPDRLSWPAARQMTPFFVDSRTRVSIFPETTHQPQAGDSSLHAGVTRGDFEVCKMLQAAEIQESKIYIRDILLPHFI